MICPKCGANLPDTAELCWSCRKTFDNKSKMDIETPAPSLKMAIKESEQEPEKPNEVEEKTQVRYQEPEFEDYIPSNYHKRKSIMLKASLLGLAGVVFLILSVVLYKPYLMAYKYYIQYGLSERPMETIMYFGIILIYVLLFFYSIPGLKYTRGDAYGKLLFCIVGFVYSFWYMSHYSDVDWQQMQYTKETYDLYWWELKSSYQIFRVLVIAGYTLTFISGLMLSVSAYSKDEKDMMKHNKKVK